MTTPNPDAAVITGGPGNEPVSKPVAAASPEMVEIDLAGTKVKVEKAVADGIKAARDAAVEQARAEAAEEARLAAATRAQPAKPAPAEGDDPFANIDTELFSNTKETIRKVVDHTVKVVKADLTAQYQAEQNRAAFWSEFYNANKDLADEKLVVDAVFRRDASKLLDLRTDKAAEKLATAAKAELLRLKGTQGGGNGKPVAEGGNLPGNLSKNRQSKPTDEPAKGPRTLTQIINERRAARAPGAKRQQAA